MITERTVSDSDPPRVLTGRAMRHRKTRVDECHRIDLADLRHDGALDPANDSRMWISRTTVGPGLPSKVVYAVTDAGSGRRLLLIGHATGAASRKSVTYPVELTATPCPFGGRRWWFVCPLVVDGKACGRRCRVLYRPYSERFFGCRLCYQLTYRSRQQHRNLWYEGFRRAVQLLEEVAAVPWPRSSRKLWRRAQRMERANASLRRFVARTAAL